MKRKNVKVGMKVLHKVNGDIYTVVGLEPDSYVGYLTVKLDGFFCGREWVNHKEIKPYKEEKVVGVSVVENDNIKFPHPLMQYIGCEVVIDGDVDNVGWIVRIDCGDGHGGHPFLVYNKNGFHSGGGYVEPYYKRSCNWRGYQQLQLVNEDGSLSPIPA